MKKLILSKRINDYSYYRGDREDRYYTQYGILLTEIENFNNFSIYIEYNKVEESEDKKRLLKLPNDEYFLKPSDFKFTKANTLYKLNDELYGNNKYRLLAEDNECAYGLYIPKQYGLHNVTFDTIIDKNLPTDAYEGLLRLNIKTPYVIVGDDYSVPQSEEKNKYYQIYCPNCKTTFMSKNAKSYDLECPICHGVNAKKHSRRYRKDSQCIVMNEFKQFREKEFGYDSKDKYNYRKNQEAVLSLYQNSTKESFYYVSSTENGCGIVIYKINYVISAMHNVITEKYNVESIIKHIVGKEMCAYKCLKSGLKAVDPFSVINVNSKNIKNMTNILYEDAEDFDEFASNNERFLKMSGFLSALKYSPERLELESFFLVFIGLVNKYPILEQIIKMGHARLFFNLYNEMINATSKDLILSYIDKLNEIVNMESTGGKDVLRFPIYIGEYLMQKNALLDEYYYWRDLYELTQLTKEQFYNLTESFNYAFINATSGLQDIGNILKFGYSIEKLMNYIIKTSKKLNISISETITTLSDYLNMCDILQVQLDLFPQDLVKQHNDISKAFKNRQHMEYDGKLNSVGSDCEKYVIPEENELDNIGIPALFKTMCVVFPKSETDFIDEGNQQHNCVGSYPNYVRDGKRVVFFIRYKNTPHKSFITAECTPKGLGQCYYSNNRRVNDSNLTKFAEYIAKKIIVGVKSGKIRALSNV